MTVGIVGAGQLGRMLALAGYPLGLDFLFLDPAEQPPAAQLAPVLRSAFANEDALAALARRCEVVTIDWENVSVEALRKLGRATRVSPPLAAIATAQDRMREKRLFERLAITTTRWRAVSSRRQLQSAIADIGLPGVLKTRRMGYDGKGQAVLRTPDDAELAWAQLGQVPLLYEELVPFDLEVSVIGVRSRNGECRVYPLNHNLHCGGILRLTRAPYGNARLNRLASQHVLTVMEHFRYVGVLTIEFFVRGGRLVANEMAPRVHNSGHWTIEGAVTSQFENHLRAILGLPLGDTGAKGYSAMINLIGVMPGHAALLRHPGLHLHDYAKEPRPGRKLGHLTVVDADAGRCERQARRLLAELAPEIHIP
ncbi:MAG TPA: 5-(carboxyamino)imidazole ribonucleotide synthase [Steroidobacteraceae bacterium]|jgi:5-(carboxyamino)imidazole ribonucleotide synthase|nr:5-(carboxyamino)imidazole ribonucleotide synthase [Steroidobacteraceae bacterium]